MRETPSTALRASSGRRQLDNLSPRSWPPATTERRGEYHLSVAIQGGTVDLEHLLGLGCFVGTAIQTTASVVALHDRHLAKSAQKTVSAANTYKPSGWWFVIFAVLSPVITVAIGVALFKYQPTGVALQTPQIQAPQKVAPCPSTQPRVGSQTTHGSDSPNLNGTGNSVTYGQSK